MTDLAKLVVRLEAQTAQYQANLEKAQRQLDKFRRTSEVSLGSIGKGLAGALAAAAGTMATLGVASIKAQDDLGDLAERIGVSTEALSELQFAAQLSGSDAETLNATITKFSRTIGEAAAGNKKYNETLSKLGVALTDAGGALRPTEDLLIDVAERFSQLQDGASKAALAQELFGKSGIKLIPLLNRGRDGIQELREEAAALGVTVKGETAAAAGAFNDTLDRLSMASAGVVKQVSAELLPTFNAIAEQMLESVKSGGALQLAIQGLGVAFKGVVSSGVIVKSVFEQLGRVLYGVGAAILAVARGEFRVAMSEVSQAFSDARRNVTDDMELVAQIWDGTVPKIEQAATRMDDALKSTIVFGDDKAAEEARKAADAAVGELAKMVQGLQQQADTYEMTEAAAIRYRIAIGDLSETFALAGERGEEYKARLIELTERNEMLKEMTEQQAEEERKLQAIRDEGARVTESLRTPAEQYADTLVRLSELLEQNAISQETFNRGVLAAQENYGKSMEKSNEFLRRASENVQDIIADSLVNGFEDGAKGMLRTFVSMLLRMQAEALAAKIATAIFGAGVGGGGGIGGAIATAVTAAGSRDSGGRGEPGKAYMIGTGAQPEMFVPDTPGSFIPRDQLTPQVTVTPQIINVKDPSEIPSAMQSREGEQAILNVITRNPSTIRNLMQR